MGKQAKQSNRPHRGLLPPSSLGSFITSGSRRNEQAALRLGLHVEPPSEREITVTRGSSKSKFMSLGILLLFTALLAAGCASGGGGANLDAQGVYSSPTASASAAELTLKPGQVFNIRDYGAKGDGVTNDSPAFQAAYNAAVAAGGGLVFIPPSSACYLFSTSINMTEDNHTVIIEGASLSTGAAGSGSVESICANTGGVLFDLTNSSNKIFESVTVTAQTGVTNPSTIGILFARDSSEKSGQGDYVEDSQFAMVLHSAGMAPSFGAYLYGSEITFMARDTFVADYPLVVTGTNIFNVLSPFQSLATSPNESETDTAFTDMELDTSGLGPAAFIHGAGNLTLSGHSWNFNMGSSYSPNLYGYALEIWASTNLDIKWRQEGFPGFAHIELGTRSSTIEGTDAPAGSPPLHAVEFCDGSSDLENDVFNITDEYSTPSTNWYYHSDAGVAILDKVDFFCGEENNCVDIPIGNYNTGYPTYWGSLRWSGGPDNQFPVIITGNGNGAPVTGTFTVLGSPVAPYSCTSLPAVPAAGGTSANILMSPQELSNLLVTGKVGGGYLTPKLCNPTSGSIAPPETTVGWTVQQ